MPLVQIRLVLCFFACLSLAAHGLDSLLAIQARLSASANSDSAQDASNKLSDWIVAECEPGLVPVIIAEPRATLCVNALAVPVAVAGSRVSYRLPQTCLQCFSRPPPARS